MPKYCQEQNTFDRIKAKSKVDSWRYGGIGAKIIKNVINNLKTVRLKWDLTVFSNVLILNEKISYIVAGNYQDDECAILILT